MQRPSPSGERAGRDGLARQLVPEHGLGAAVAQHAGGEALVERGQRLPRDGGQHVDLRVEADDRGRREHLTCRGGEPGRAREHGIPDGGWYRSVPTGEHLGDVEGVAAGAFEERVQVDVRPAGQLRHRGAAQRPHGDAPDPSDGGELTEQHPNGMVGPDLVVAEGQQQQGGAALAAPGEVPDQLQRRGVRPVHVLDEPDGRLGAQRGPHRREQADPVDGFARVNGHGEAECGRDVHQGPQRRRRGGPVAATAQHPARRGGHEVGGEAGLPGSGLAADQHRRADAATGLVQRGGQRGQLLGPLQQHTHS